MTTAVVVCCYEGQHGFYRVPKEWQELPAFMAGNLIERSLAAGLVHRMKSAAFGVERNFPRWNLVAVGATFNEVREALDAIRRVTNVRDPEEHLP